MTDITKLVTVEEFERILKTHPDKLLELIHGEIVEKLIYEEHGIIAGNIAFALKAYLKSRKIGRVGMEIRHGIPDDKHNDRIPDVSVNLDTERPIVKQGSVPHMPDVAVEVKSPDDAPQKVQEKANYYLENGSRLVWLVFPDRQQVEQYVKGEAGMIQRQTFGIEDTLSGGEVLPEFTLPVKVIFEVE